MPGELICGNCGAGLQDNWKTCPFCSLPLNDAVANDAEPNAAIVPIVIPEWDPPMAATKQFERDQSHVGIGLIVLGVLGFLGGCGLVVSGQLTQLRSLEFVVALFLIGGGLTVAAVVLGTVIVSNSPGNAGNKSTGMLGGLLAGFMAIGVCGLTVFAMFIYALETCLNGCQ